MFEVEHCTKKTMKESDIRGWVWTSDLAALPRCSLYAVWPMEILMETVLLHPCVKDTHMHTHTHANTGNTGTLPGSAGEHQPAYLLIADKASRQTVDSRNKEILLE